MNSLPAGSPGGAQRGDVPDRTSPLSADPGLAPETALPLLTRVWLALWGPLPILNWLGILGLVRLGTLPLPLRWMFGGFVLLELGSAAFTAHPLAAGLFGLLRSALLLGLLATGWQLGRARALLNLLPGLLVVLVTALVYSALHPGQLHARLMHPTYQFVSLGLAAALVLWMAAYWPGQPGRRAWTVPLRILAGALALVVLVLGGSRGPLAAALIGLLVGGLALTFSGGRARAALPWWLGAALVLGGGVTFWATQPAAASSHLSQLGLNSRDTYWEEAAGVFRASPLGGAGVGQLGNAVLSTQDNCFQGGPTYSVGCQGWMLTLSAQPWFAPARKLSWLAHNVALHSLAETGLVGTAGTFLLLGLVAAAAFVSRQPLLLALVTGYSVVNLFDNATVLPSLAVSEVFWLAGGVAMREAYSSGRWTGWRPLPAASLWGGGLLLVSLLPVVLPALLPNSATPPRLLLLNAARSTASQGPTTLFLGLGDLPTHPVRLRLELCTPVCGVERLQDLTPDAAGEWWGGLALPQLAPRTTVRLQVLPPETGLLSARPLGEVVWRQP